MHQKCDAKRPYCTTCDAANKQDQCIYEDDAQRNLIQSLVARTRQLEERLASAEQSPRNSPPTPNHATSSSSGMQVQMPISLPAEAFGAFPVWKPPVTDAPVNPTNPPSRTTLEQYRDL